jgi:YafQ family addiction module toxin component
MVYSAEYSEHILKLFDKMAKKNKAQLIAINAKISEILEKPHHFKPLRGDMKGSRRVHFGHFVMTFEIDEKRKVIKFLDYAPHDNIY